VIWNCNGSTVTEMERVWKAFSSPGNVNISLDPRVRKKIPCVHFG
jgi:hypothetical protein